MLTDLRLFASQIRALTLKGLHRLGYGHFGGSLSVIEALAALYGAEMKYDPTRPNCEDRDYFVLSKGHAGPALYATLAASGFFPISTLWTLNANGTSLPSHPDRRMVVGVEMTTGSMGQGISAAAGIAYGLRCQNRRNRVYTVVGDGELNEGQCWEAAQFIAHRELTNLVVMVDNNKRQLDGWTADISRTFDFADKFDAFGFAAERVDGNDVYAVADTLARARSAVERPVCIVMDTVKGAGVPFIAQSPDNHHMRLDDAASRMVEDVIAELEAELEQAGVPHA